MDRDSPSTEVGEDTDFGATGPTSVPCGTVRGFTSIESLNAHILELLQTIEALELP